MGSSDDPVVELDKVEVTGELNISVGCRDHGGSVVMVWIKEGV